MPNYQTPGVYIEEVNAFPNSIVPVQTALPAFIGYTPQAEHNGQSLINTPKKIRSFAEFIEVFCLADQPAPAEPVKQYSPQYYLVKQASKPTQGDFIKIENEYYSILPDPNTIYYLFNSVRLFYDNGGKEAYIVSVGTYGTSSGIPINPGEQIINPNVRLNELLNGLVGLENEFEPTLYICPEATLLSVAENGTLMQSMLLQNEKMQTAMSIFDLIGGNSPDPLLFTQDIQTFRNNTGTNSLDFGAAYYPFVGTTLMQQNDLDLENLFGGDIEQLKPLLNSSSAPNPVIETILDDINLTRSQKNIALINTSSTYKEIIKHVLAIANLIPASGGIAGIITRTDIQRGVWKAPANTSIRRVSYLPINISNQQQDGLNVDPVSGKSINAIRAFTGKGILVWGARTLNGNSNEWRYVPVRRLFIFIKQSCLTAIRVYTFEPNERITWVAVKSMLTNFLTNLWRQGGLQGATPDDSFFVKCGLGETMTATDILENKMIIEIGLAAVRPAEFIILKFTLKMVEQ
jgi:hypothetical protein